MEGQPDPIVAQDLAGVLYNTRQECRALAGSTVLLSGASGFVGRYLVEALILYNETAAAPCRLALPSRNPEVLRVRYPDALESGWLVPVSWQGGAADRRRWPEPDYVVHAAAPVDPRVFAADPGGSLRSMLSTAEILAEHVDRSNVTRLVVVSSGAVYGRQPSDVGELPETFTGAPDLSMASSAYAEGKRATEMLFRAARVDTRAARLFSVTGPYQDLQGAFAVPDLIRQADAGHTLRLSGDGSAVRNYCYASDVTTILLKLLLGEPKYNAYNVGNPGATVSILEAAQTIARIFGGLTIETAPPTEAAPSRYVPDCTRLLELWEPAVGFEEGVWRECSSLKQRGLISGIVKRPD